MMPAKPRSTRNAPAKVRLGSRCWTRVKTSPLASLRGSHQPWPSWLTIRISAWPRRYLRLRRVLCARSSRHDGGSRSSSTAQLTPAFSHSISASCSLIVPSSFRNRRGRGRSGSMPSLSICSAVPSCQPRSRRGARACEAWERTARRTLVAGLASAVTLSSRIGCLRTDLHPADAILLSGVLTFYFLHHAKELASSGALLVVRILHTSLGHLITTNHRIRV